MIALLHHEDGQLSGNGNLCVSILHSPRFPAANVYVRIWLKLAVYALILYGFHTGVLCAEGVDFSEIEAKARKGDAKAQCDLGTSKLRSGNFVEGIQWISRAAEQGLPEAQLLLGTAYCLGKGAPQDDVEAAKWFRKAAEQSLASAQYAIGFAYEHGRGVKQDHSQAAAWYLKAAAQGSAEAQANLGAMYGNGIGAPKNTAEALKWVRKAAEQGIAESQYSLGALYAAGEGVPQNDVEAYMWVNLAAAKGDDDAIKLRAVLSRRMSRTEIVEAQRRSASFVPHKESGMLGIQDRELWSGSKACGSGFFITEDGYLVTNFHVVDGAKRIQVKTKGNMYAATVIRVDHGNDIALLKCLAAARPLPIRQSHDMRLGDSVFTIGFPNPQLQGLEPKMTDGKISSLAGAQDDPRFFQVSVAVQPGNSGGALVDSYGNVVGTITARLSDKAALESSGALPQAVNYAIKSSYLLSVLESVPEVRSKLKEQWPARQRKHEDVVREVEQAAVLILAFEN